MKTIFTLLLFWLTVQTMQAQTDTAKLNQLFAQYDHYQKAMLSTCIMDHGKLVYHQSIGYSNVAQQHKANEETRYHIGSITKMFTSVIVFQLAEEKKLSLDDKLNQYFPSLPNSSKITIAELLGHRSGLFNFTDDSLYGSYMEKPMSDKQLLALFEKQPSEFEPDSKAAYSNTNYVVLSMIIEKVSGRSYASAVKNRICKKINLKHTEVDTRDLKDTHIARSYTFEDKQWKASTITDPSVPRGAGAILSTPDDLCTFITALFENKLISEASVQAMTTIQDNYGKGIFEIPFGKRKGFGHTGGIDGFESMLAYFPEDKMAFCITGNGWNYVMNDAAIALLSIYYKIPYTIPSFEKRVLDKQASLSIEGIYNNSSIGMKITIRKEGDAITAQATGQSAFTLDKISELEYKFDAAKIHIEFIRDASQQILSFKLKQNGMDLSFEKE